MCCPQVGQETFRLCRELLDGVILVSNSAISAAIKVGQRIALITVCRLFFCHCNQPSTLALVECFGAICVHARTNALSSN
jgi:hypothetical protein